MIKDKYLFIFVITGEYKSFHRRSFIENFYNYTYPNPVIVINRPKDFLPTFFRKNFKFRQPFLSHLNKITVITPFLMIHDQLSRFMPQRIKKLSYFFFINKFNNYLIPYNNKKKILIIMHPDLIDYIDIIKYDYLIYDMYDEFLLNKKYKKRHSDENKLVDKSDFVFCISYYLKSLKKKIYTNKSIMPLTCAIDSDLFSKIEENTITYPYKKVVGFVGNIKSYIDFDLIIYLAENRKDIQFVIIGFNPNEEIKNKTKGLNNIIFEGSKKYEELPKYIKSFNIGIIPYKVEDEYIKSISPMKLYEYLASNVFVLSSPIPDVVDFKKNSKIGSYVEIANNYNEFLEKLDLLLLKDKFQLTKEELYTISWEKRFSDLFEELNKLGIIEYN
jgi:hypothetical protein